MVKVVSVAKFPAWSLGGDIWDVLVGSCLDMSEAGPHTNSTSSLFWVCRESLPVDDPCRHSRLPAAGGKKATSPYFEMPASQARVRAQQLGLVARIQISLRSAVVASACAIALSRIVVRRQWLRKERLWGETIRVVLRPISPKAREWGQ